MAKINNYYYNLLNKEQQKAYYAIMQGLDNMQESFSVPLLSGKELTEIYFMVRLDHPELFYSVSFSYRFTENSLNAEMIPVYLFRKDKLKEHKSAMESRVKKLVRQAEKLDEKGKEIFIHDFIINNVKYDKLKKEYSHEITGALGNGVAVCEGIAKAVKILCDEMGIWCIVAISESNPEKGIKYRHAWNVIRIGGQYYHLDATFDNTLSRGKEPIRYDYFNLSDKQIFRDHEPVVWKIPACTDGDHFYYKEKKVSWTTLDEVRKRTKQAVKKGKTLLFHWRGGYFTKEIFADIVEIFKEEAELRDKQAICSVNVPQAVVKVYFVDGKGEEKTEIEHADEDTRY
ncbi:MAG: transglutaminase domain-containing protein [Clostridia bacterium]|nr:transglutaminase domain-containing protein [Clostridia bacterium]